MMVVVGKCNSDLALIRINEIGRIDVNFGVYGLVVEEDLGVACAVAIDSEGMILTAGRPVSAEDDFELSRFLSSTAAPMAGVLQFGGLSYTVEEDEGVITVTVTRLREANFGDVSVDYFSMDVTARAGLDYTPVAGTLFFADTETTQTFEVPITDDATYECDESLVLMLASPTGGAVLNSCCVAKLTILKNDRVASTTNWFYSWGTTVNENAGTVEVRVNRSGSSGTITVDYATADGTAVEGEDYTGVFGTLTFGPGETYRTFEVPILGDSLLEDDETFTIMLTNPRGGIVDNSVIPPATVTILDIDPNICHNAGDLDTTFDGDGKVTTDLGETSYEYANAAVLQPDGKIVAAGRSGYDDYVALVRYNTDGSLDAAFGSGGIVLTSIRAATAEAYAVMLQPDGKIVAVGRSLGDGHEQFVLVRYNSGGSLDASFGTNGVAAQPIAWYNNQLPAIAFQDDGKIIAAGESWNGMDDDLAVLRLNPDGSLDDTFGTGGQMTYDTTDTTDVNAVVVLPDGDILLALTSYLRLLRLNADGSIDGTFGTGGVLTTDVAGFFGPGVTVLCTSGYTALLVQPDGRILAGASGYMYGYDELTGLQVEYKRGLLVTRFNADFTLDTTFGTGGLALSDFDGQISSFSVAALALEADGRIVAGGGDVARLYSDGVPDIGFGSGGLVVSDYTIKDVLVQPDGRILTVGGKSSDFGLVRYAGGAANGRFRLNSGDYTVGEEGGSLDIIVTRTCGMDGAVSVTYATSDDTAVAGVDYTAVAGTLYWADREWGSQTFSIPILGDDVYEGNLTFNIALSDPTGGADLNVMNAAVVTIVDDENPGRFRFSALTYDAIETDGTVTITVERIDGSGGPVSVDYVVTGGTAATPDDFTGGTGTLSFADREAVRTFDITLVDDADVEGPETIVFSLENPTGGASLALRSVARLTVEDDDEPPPPEPPGAFRFGAPVFDVGEEEGSALIVVTRTGGSGGEATVDFALVDGTAKYASDYAASTGTLLFLDGQTTATFSVPIFQDSALEDTETATLTLSNPTGGASLGDRTSATLRIADDDVGPVSVTIDDVSVDEGDSGQVFATFAVSLAAPALSSVAVDFVTEDGTATVADGDYVAQAGQVVFEKGELTGTISIAVNGDTVLENNETFFVVISAGSLSVSVDDGRGICTIVDDEGRPQQAVWLTIDDVEVIEGDSGTTLAVFTASLSTTAISAVEVTFTTADGSATVADGDYIARVGAVTFDPGELTKTIEITVNGDADFELDETFSVAIDTEAAGVAVADGTGICTILNDDDQPTPASVSIDDVEAPEGDADTTAFVFTVTLSEESDVPVDVSYATVDGKAVAGSDYVAAAGVVTFLPGELTQTIAVEVTGDTVFEADEAFVVQLSNAINATLADGLGIGTIQNDETAAVVLPLDAVTPASYIDESGDAVTVALKGDGAGEIHLMAAGGCDAALIVLNGTTERSSLVIKTEKGSETTVCHVVVHGSLAALTAKTTDLLGDLTVDGWIKKLTLDDVIDGHTVSIGPSTNPKAAVSIVFDEARGTRIESQVPVKSVTGSAWTAVPGINDALVAPWVGKLTFKGKKANTRLGMPAVPGDLEASLDLSGVGAPKATLGAAKTMGILSGAWDIVGDVGKIAVGGDFTCDLHVAGDLKALDVKGGDLDGPVTVDGCATKISVAAAKNKATGLHAGGTITTNGAITIEGADPKRGISLKQLAVKGGWLAGDVTTFGDLGKVCVTGGDVTSRSTIGGCLGSVAVRSAKDRTTGATVGGSAMGARFGVAGLLKSVKLTGDFTDSDIDAGELSKVQVKGVIGQTGGSHEIRAHAGNCKLQDATWKGVIDTANDYWCTGGVHAWVG